MNLTIRAETLDDYAVIYELIKTAFQTAKVSDGNEQDFAVKLRESDHYISELALVAVVDNKLVGHVMFTKTYVMLPTGDKFEALLLAPLSVLNEYRQQGIASTLIKQGFELAKAMGYQAVFLCGDPAYYSRFGFQPVDSFAIDSPEIPKPYAMACELTTDALTSVTGTICFTP